MRAMQTFMITSVTRHQQCFSTRNTKINGRNNAAPIMQRHLPERSPETGVAMRRELIVKHNFSLLSYTCTTIDAMEVSHTDK
jgi:hypothetical protein